MFYAGYVLFQVPSNLVLAKLGARIWLPCITAAWGVVATCCIFIKGVVAAAMPSMQYGPGRCQTAAARKGPRLSRVCSGFPCSCAGSCLRRPRGLLRRGASQLVTCMCLCAAPGPASFYALRLALGVAESGAFPAMWHLCGQVSQCGVTSIALSSGSTIQGRPHQLQCIGNNHHSSCEASAQVLWSKRACM